MEQKLVITLMADGGLKVEGPIERKMMCYGMLEMARDLIKDFQPSPIVKPNGNLINLKPGEA